MKTRLFSSLAIGILACAPAFAAARTEMPVDLGSAEKPKIKKDKKEKRTKDAAAKNRRPQTKVG